MSTQYYSGQGVMLVADRDTSGNPKAFRDVQNVPSLEVDISVTKATKKESRSGQRLIDKQIQTEKSVSIKVTLDSFDADNLAMALYGSNASIASSTVTAETLPDDLEVGDFVRLEHVDVTSLVITDSASEAATLTEGTDYKVTNAKLGTIKILSVGSYTQPFKAAYSYGAANNVAMFSQSPGEKWLRFEGLNTADSNAPMLVELYNVQLDPPSALALINDDFGSLELTGSAMYDDTKESDTTLGQFGRILQLAAS